MIYAVLHFGGLDFHCRLRRFRGRKKYESIKVELLDLYQSASLGEVYDRIKDYFGGRHYSLKDLFREERRRLINLILGDRPAVYQKQFRGWVEADEGVIRKLVEWEVPLPPAIGSALRLSLHQAWEEGLEDDLSLPRKWEDLGSLVKRMEKLGFPVDRNQMGEDIQARMEEMLRLLPGSPEPEGVFQRLKSHLRGAKTLGIPLNIWTVQNGFLDACLTADTLDPEARKAYETFAGAVELPVSEPGRFESKGEGH